MAEETEKVELFERGDAVDVMLLNARDMASVWTRGWLVYTKHGGVVDVVDERDPKRVVTVRRRDVRRAR